MTEGFFDLEKVRTLHSVPSKIWTGQEGSAYWCEWDHWGEKPRSFEAIISDLREQNWQKLILPGSTCIDIGAHSGDTTIPMGLFCFDRVNYRRGTVLAVEPNPEVLGVLEINLALNTAIADFKSVNVAITEKDTDQIELADHGNSNCNGGILSGDYSDYATQRLEQAAGMRYFAKGLALETLLTTSLDSEQIKEISFIKTDLEGYDKNVIRSSAQILRILRPTLFVEWFGWFGTDDDDDLFKAIEEIDYVALHPRALTPIDRSQRTSDLVCVHRSKLGAL